MAHRTTLQFPVNRVEGDLEVKVEIADGRVADAWCSGTMFRGFEQILVGRAALDGLVITPRVCGICGTAHLTAACRALDAAAGAELPDNGLRLRNAALLVEHLQSDVRHAFLMFMADFANSYYRHHGLYEEAVRRYAPFRGETVVETIHETKKVLEIVAILGGQWPHSCYMVPGGTVSVPSASDLLQCLQLLARYRRWYEKRVLGCPLDRWAAITGAAELETWLAEKEEHRQSEVGFYLTLGGEAGLDATGKGHGNFLSYGALDLPQQTRVRCPIAGGTQLVPAGFARGVSVETFDQENVTEQVTHSWFEADSAGHPLDARTSPYASGREGDKYSWAKAPRYDGVPAETGPLAEMVVGQRPLFLDLLARNGPGVLVRELARMTRPALLLPVAEAWLREMLEDGGGFYVRPGEIVEGVGVGLTHASRGALGHWVKIQDRKIVHYQIITPTAWHASPRDDNGTRGTLEEALVGTPVKDSGNPVEIGHVIRSFDPCLVCTVHSVSKGGSPARIRI